MIYATSHNDRHRIGTGTCTCTMHITTHMSTHISTKCTIRVKAPRAADNDNSSNNLRRNVGRASGDQKWRNVLIGLLAFVMLPAFAFGQRDAKIPDPDPELERKTFQVADGFEVNLFAADPLLAKPIQMNFDAKGRLWVASSETYPQIAPGAKADDKIIILEDMKGVGKADKTTIFARGLLIPTGLEPGDGGVYVANSTELLHI
jgi:glucose/arabinose dehydrogenase